MHSLIFFDKDKYKQSVEKIISSNLDNYNKLCYISFNDPHHIIIKMLKNINADTEKFIVVDASRNVDNLKAINNVAYIMNVNQLFDVYLFLRNLIKKEKIEAIFIDSISALIYKHNQLPLKEMLTTLLLEIGSFNCDSLFLAFKEHTNHEVLNHINGFIGRYQNL